MPTKPIQLEITDREIRPGTVLITLVGDVMRGPESERLEPLLRDYIAKGYRQVIFELAGVRRIDSTGIGRFIFALNTLMGIGGQLRMAGAIGYVRDCFRVTRLDTVFRFCDTVDDALAGLPAAATIP